MIALPLSSSSPRSARARARDFSQPLDIPFLHTNKKKNKKDSSDDYDKNINYMEDNDGTATAGNDDGGRWTADGVSVVPRRVLEFVTALMSNASPQDHDPHDHPDDPNAEADTTTTTTVILGMASSSASSHFSQFAASTASPSSSASSCSNSGRWHCLMTVHEPEQTTAQPQLAHDDRRDVGVLQHLGLHVWFEDSEATLMDRKENPHSLHFAHAFTTTTTHRNRNSNSRSSMSRTSTGSHNTRRSDRSRPDTENTRRWRVALVDDTTRQRVHLYAVDSIQGDIALWILSEADLRLHHHPTGSHDAATTTTGTSMSSSFSMIRPSYRMATTMPIMMMVRPPVATARLPLAARKEKDDEDEEDEFVSCVERMDATTSTTTATAFAPPSPPPSLVGLGLPSPATVLLLGSSHGNVYWMQTSTSVLPVHVTTTRIAQLQLPPSSDGKSTLFTTAAAATTSFLSRMLSIPPPPPPPLAKKPRYEEDPSSSSREEPHIHHHHRSDHHASSWNHHPGGGIVAIHCLDDGVTTLTTAAASSTTTTTTTTRIVMMVASAHAGVQYYTVTVPHRHTPTTTHRRIECVPMEGMGIRDGPTLQAQLEEYVLLHSSPPDDHTPHSSRSDDDEEDRNNSNATSHHHPVTDRHRRRRFTSVEIVAATTTTTLVLHLLVLLGTSDSSSSSSSSSSISSQLYWVVLDPPTRPCTLNKKKTAGHRIRTATWLNQFPRGDAVTIQGLQVAADGMGYAAVTVLPPVVSPHLRPPRKQVMVLAFEPIGPNGSTNENMTDHRPNFTRVQQLELPYDLLAGYSENPDEITEERYPHKSGILLSRLELDWLTHGCTAWTPSGLQIRLRRHNPSSTDGIINSHRSISLDDQVVSTLLQHMRGAFQVIYDHGCSMSRFHPLPPPSLTMSHFVAHVQDAIVQLAVEMQLNNRILRGEPRLGESLLPRRVNDAENNGIAESSLVVLLDHDAIRASEEQFDRHEIFVRWLQVTGLYRSLSSSCKLTLFGLGQQVAAFAALIRKLATLTDPQYVKSWFPLDLKSAMDVADWLERLDSFVFNNIADVVDTNKEQFFFDCLIIALKTATSYSENHLYSTYDITDSYAKMAITSASLRMSHSLQTREVVAPWTSSSTLQSIMLRQLERWDKLSTASSNVSLPIEIVEWFVVVALHSFQESFTFMSLLPLQSTPSTGNMEGIRTKVSTGAQYATAQRIGVALLRSVRSGIDKRIDGTGDELAWNVSIEHSYFEGLCEMSIDHEHFTHSAQYSLEPLFDHFKDNSCAAEPNLSFAQFVLQWHIRQSLIGHALEYGKRHCPDHLKQLLNSDDRLRSYRWILAMQEMNSGSFSEFEVAAESLWSNAASHVGDKSFKEAKLDLATAVLTNRLCMASSSVEARSRQENIDKFRLLLAAHEEILGMDYQGIVHSPSKLLDLCFSQLASSKEMNTLGDKVHLYSLALVVCTCFTLRDDMQRNARVVWLSAIQEDVDWLETAHCHYREGNREILKVVLHETVVGRLIAATTANSTTHPSTSDEPRMYCLENKNLVSFSVIERLLPSSTLPVGLTRFLLDIAQLSSLPIERERITDDRKTNIELLH